MEPVQVANILRQIASKIEASEKPDIRFVNRDLQRVLAAMPDPNMPDPNDESESLGLDVQYSVHGTLSVTVTVKASWLDDDGDLLPQYKEHVRQMAKQRAGKVLREVDREGFQVQIEEM